jgi:2-polyprenyl-6-methoxyphenol hydroxylase-like FAD-dependent oxidoreductase
MTGDAKRKPRIAIIGGGIGGLTAAAALRRRGIEVEVFEQSAKIGEIGAGVALTPNAMNAYRAPNGRRCRSAASPSVC